MLMFSRRTDEAIKIGDEITITVLRFHPNQNQVSLGIDAPAHLSVYPSELSEDELKIWNKSQLEEM